MSHRRSESDALDRDAMRNPDREARPMSGNMTGWSDRVISGLLEENNKLLARNEKTGLKRSEYCRTGGVEHEALQKCKEQSIVLYLLKDQTIYPDAEYLSSLTV
jgi:hypothetical protein